MCEKGYDIVCVKEVTGSESANLYFACGWVLVDSVPCRNAEGDSNITYSLGWLKSNGDIKLPDLPQPEYYR